MRVEGGPYAAECLVTNVYEDPRGEHKIVKRIFYPLLGVDILLFEVSPELVDSLSDLHQYWSLYTTLYAFDLTLARCALIPTVRCYSVFGSHMYGLRELYFRQRLLRKMVTHFRGVIHAIRSLRSYSAGEWHRCRQRCLHIFTICHYFNLAKKGMERCLKHNPPCPAPPTPFVPTLAGLVLNTIITAIKEPWAYNILPLCLR